MQNRTPVKRADRPALPEFEAVPRKTYRHDGWTPERQKAFIEALADTGCVTRAAAMVNMAQANCYTLRRAPGAESFRRAWDAALDFGLQRLKDIAFERAIEGQLVPVFVAGRLMGFRRKRNDALLMFCLRHYGQDAAGKRTTINYFSTRATAGAAAGGSGAGAGEAGGAGAAQASTTLRTVTSGGAGGGTLALASPERDDGLAEEIAGFGGVALDAEAEAAIGAALEACALRRREADEAIDMGGELCADALEADAGEQYVPLPDNGSDYRGELEPVMAIEDAGEPFRAGEPDWTLAGAEMPDWALPPEERRVLPAPVKKRGRRKRVASD